MFFFFFTILDKEKYFNRIILFKSFYKVLLIDLKNTSISKFKKLGIPQNVIKFTQTVYFS